VAQFEFCELLESCFGNEIDVVNIYRSPQFTDLCVKKFDRTDTRSMKFDDFIQCCVMLKTLTDAFRKHDTSQTGVVQINYEQVSSTLGAIVIDQNYHC
jgi:hypothetical protein